MDELIHDDVYDYRTNTEEPDRFSFWIDDDEQEEKNESDRGDDQVGGDMMGEECIKGEEIGRIVDAKKGIRDDAE